MPPAAGPVDMGSRGVAAATARSGTDGAPNRACEATATSSTAGSYSLEFDPRTGMLDPLPTRAGASRCAARDWPHGSVRRSCAVHSMSLAPNRRCASSSSRPTATARRDRAATYDGALREVTWRMRGDELIVSLSHRLRGAADILGVTFDYPEKNVSLGKRWVGEGPVPHLEEPRCGNDVRPARSKLLALDAGRELRVSRVRGILRRVGLARDAHPRRQRGHRNHSDVPYFGLYARAAARSRSSNCPTSAGRSCTRAADRHQVRAARRAGPAVAAGAVSMASCAVKSQ